MIWSRSFIWLTVWFAALALASQPCPAQNGPRPGALTIVEAGFAPDGLTPRYTVEAMGADLRDLLTALLRKTGKDFVIQQDVSGPVSLTLRDKTLDEILAHLCRIARPPIAVRSGAVITVVTEPALAESPDAADRHAPEAAGRAQTVPPASAGRVARVQGPSVPVMQNQIPALGRPVTLSIPDERPMPLRSVALQLEQQTRIPIRLDPRVPGDVGVAARFTDTPLSLVLESIARTGALKWQLRQDGTVVLAPSDWLLLSLRGVPAWGDPASVCPSCGKPVLGSWSFCPYDGKPLPPRGQSRQGAPQGKR